MKIAIVSDTHGCVETWRTLFARYFYDADLIIHAGDVLYHGPRNAIPAEYQPAALAQEINDCPVPLLIAAGNCDAEVDGMVLQYPLQNPFAFAQIEGVRILVYHGHGLSSEEKEKLAVRYKLQLFVEGHTHLPALAQKGETVFLNPGSPGMSKAEDGRGTFAILEDGQVTLRYVDSGEVHSTLTLGKGTIR